MPWTDEDQQPTRTREELLDRVTRRGEELRRRRRTGRGLACGLAVLTAATIGGLGIFGGGEKPTVDVATDGPSTTTGADTWLDPVAGPPGEVPTDTSTPGTTPTPASEPTPTTTPGPAAAIPAPSATTSTRASSTTVPAASPTPPTSTPAVGPPCSSEHLKITADAEKAEFRPGEVVHVSTTISNKTLAPCYYQSLNFRYWFGDAAGRRLSGGAKIPSYDSPQRALKPGETFTETIDWHQQDCTDPARGCVQAAPGDYKADITWSIGPSFETTVPFRLVP